VRTTTGALFLSPPRVGGKKILSPRGEDRSVLPAPERGESINFWGPAPHHEVLFEGGYHDACPYCCERTARGVFIARTAIPPLYKNPPPLEKRGSLPKKKIGATSRFTTLAAPEGIFSPCATSPKKVVFPHPPQKEGALFSRGVSHRDIGGSQKKCPP